MPSYILAKVGRRARMETLIREGLVHMQRLEYYCGLESRVVGDPDEGLLARYSADNPTLRVTFDVDGRRLPMEGIRSITVNSSVRTHAVYCMCSVREERAGIDPSTGPILRNDGATIWWDTRMGAFGNSMVLFKDSVEFVSRLERAASSLGYVLEHGPVGYVPSSHCGAMGPFCKLDRYQYQGECRFVTTASVVGPVVLRLGSLTDIAGLIDLV